MQACRGEKEELHKAAKLDTQLRHTMEHLQLQSGSFCHRHSHADACRHVGGEKELREAIELYTQLQHTMEDIHGLRNAQSALALRSIADVHMMLKEYGAPPLGLDCRSGCCWRPDGSSVVCVVQLILHLRPSGQLEV